MVSIKIGNMSSAIYPISPEVDTLAHKRAGDGLYVAPIDSIFQLTHKGIVYCLYFPRNKRGPGAIKNRGEKGEFAL